jgi:hypothetical protein
MERMVLPLGWRSRSPAGMTTRRAETATADSCGMTERKAESPKEKQA